MIYHIAAMLAGFLMDLLLGDPYWLPHPIRLIGNWISFLEKRLLGSKTEEKHTTPEQEQRRGMLLVLAVLSSTVFVTAVLLLGAYRLHPYLGAVIESIMTYQILATKMPEGGEHESLSGTEKRGYCGVTESGIHDRRQRHGMSG